MPSAPHPPTAGECRRILIVGAGGFGREAHQWFRDASPADARKICGFLSADTRRLDGFSCPLPIIGDPGTFVPEPDDGLVLAIGVPEIRRHVAEVLERAGGRFLTVVHPTAIVASSAVIGTGAVVSPFCIVSDAARVGRFVLLNYHSSLGHDATAGDFSVLSPYAALGGNAHVAEDVFLGMHASVGPARRVGARSKISAQSCALADVPADSIVFGVPGRIAPRIPL